LSYLDFGLTLAGMWFGTLAGAVALIVAVIEVFKRFGSRSEESTQSAETKSTSAMKEETLSEEEITTIVTLAAVQAYLSEEKKGAAES
jgi:flagellar biogenesis protein FliO